MKKYYLITLIVMLFSVYMGCKKEKEPVKPTPPIYTNGQGEIGEIGGTVKIDNSSSPLNGVELTIPANAISSVQNISINLAPSNIIFPGDKSAKIIEFLPNGLEFSEPVEIKIPFNEDVDTAKLNLYYYNQANNLIEQIPYTMDWDNKQLIAYTNHFSSFLISEHGVWAQVKYFHDNPSQKTYVNILVAGFSEEGQYLGLEGIPTNIPNGDEGYRSVKWAISDDPDAPWFKAVSLEVSLRKKVWPKWLSPTIQTEVLWVDMPYSIQNGSTSLDIYNPDYSYFQTIYNLPTPGEEDREVLSSGQELCFTFDEPLNNGDEYFIDAKWAFGHISNNDFDNDYTPYYKICDYHYSLLPNDMLESNIIDLNENGVLDNFDGYSPNNAPTAIFSFTPNEGTTNTNFQFDASGSYDNSKNTTNITKYEWDLNNDGFYDKTGVNITNKFSAQGTYKVTLRVTDNGGLTNKTSKFVTVSNGATPPTANFTVSPSTGNTTTEFTFNASLSSSNAKYFRWDFNNDGNWDTQYSTSKTFTHKYNTHGNYIVKLEVKSSENLIGQKTNSVVVAEPGNLTITNPNSSTTWEMGDYNVPISWETGDLGGDVKLQLYKGNNKLGTLTPSGTPNDGSYNGYNVQTTLSEGDDYRIKILWIADESKFDFSDYFSIVEAANLPPTKPKDEYPINGSTGIELNDVLFWTSSDPEGDPIKYDIYFGTSSNPSLVVSNETNNVYSLSNLNVISNTTYYWKIIAKDDQGNSTTGSIWSFSTQSNGSAPIADFSADITSGEAPLTVNFTDQSTNTPTTWQWNFGDGGTSTQQNPSHTYNTDGSYTVSLTVNNEYGSDTKTKTGYIYVGSGGGGEPCPGTPTVTDADGNVYNTVQIGGQCWMKENLRVGTRIDGSQEMSNNSIIEKYCYGDDPVNCETYGGLYQWDEMMQYTTTQGVQGICPTGWHLPSDDEWTILSDFLGGTNIAGGKMKEAGTTHWNSPNTGATNSSGFTALPGGYRISDGSFSYLGNGGYWWSSTENSGSYALYRGLFYDYDQALRDYNSKAYGFSVRCLKN